MINEGCRFNSLSPVLLQSLLAGVKYFLTARSIWSVFRDWQRRVDEDVIGNEERINRTTDKAASGRRIAARESREGEENKTETKDNKQNRRYTRRRGHKAQSQY
ncbi:uncharacterized protein LOC124412764 [Diprion similis]|uniref:uncharacterized protein LOC124412764 n=1 Tax=Diprion similis TaxID=362088 RepID=UPI001EF7F399|nr:uncharacterized protein LOC124412764 [Diprion similis]